MMTPPVLIAALIAVSMLASPQTAAPPAPPAPPAAPPPATPAPTVPSDPSAPVRSDKSATPVEQIVVTIPSSGYKLTLVPIPGDAAKTIAPFWMSTTEIPWDAFDVYVFKLDEPEDTRGGIDVKTHPSKPYLPPDRGFGHANFAAISITSRAAEGFCAWLTKKLNDGSTFRLATEDEWEHAARAGLPAAEPYGFEGGPAKLPEHAWFKDNADAQPHEIATKSPNAWGLYDMHGNVSEWVKGRDAKPAIKGGSYQDAAETLSASWRSPQQPAWNSSDPQVPKSRWWLSDAPFIGFRIVREAAPKDDANDGATNTPSTPK